jgi:septal ring factor EnvC (AmiA/AmiB activator)
MTSGLLEVERAAPTEYADVPPVELPRWRRPWLALLAAIVMMTAAGFVVANEVQTDHHFDTTRQSLNATQQQLALVRSDLASLGAALRVVNGQITQSTTALANDQTELQDAQTALAKSEGTVSSQGASINVLQSCLGGITQALNALSVGDQATAISALNSVTSSCQSAVVENG